MPGCVCKFGSQSTRVFVLHKALDTHNSGTVTLPHCLTTLNLCIYYKQCIKAL